MVKANPIIEVFGLSNFFYKNKDLFLVKYPNKRVERHYYEIDEKGMVKVYEKPEELKKNPSVKDSEYLSLDETTKKNIYTWVFGQPFVTPLFSHAPATRPMIGDEDLDQIFDAGFQYHELISDSESNKNGGPNLVIIVILLGLAMVANLYLSFRIAEHLGLLKGILPTG